MLHNKNKHVFWLALVLSGLLATMGVAQATVISDFSQSSRASAGQPMLSNASPLHFGKHVRANRLDLRSPENEPNPFVLLGLAIVSIAGLRRCQTRK